MIRHIIFLALCFCYNGLRAIDVAEVRQLPKAELHLHLGGSYPLSYLKTIATNQEYAALEKGIDLFVDGVDYSQCFFVFGLISKIINTYQRVEDGTYHLCKELQKDGVTYVEIRTGLKDFGSGYEDYLKAVIKGIDRASSKDFRAKVLLSLKRTSTPEFAQKTIDLALAYTKDGVVGIDISDNSTKGDINTILPILRQGKSKGLDFVIHMGESPLEKDQILLLEGLEPVRIGHGVHLHPEALAWVKKHKTPIEVCLSSGVCAKMIKKYSEHPGFTFYANGHPVVICTDDPLIFRTTLSEEYMLFAKEFGSCFEKIKDLIEIGHSYKIG